MLEGAARLLTTVVGLALLSFVLDRVFRLSLPARVAMVLFAVIALCVVFWREIVAPLRLKLDPLTLAAALDRMAGQDGHLTARVGTILELPSVLDQSNGESLVMLHRAAVECHAALSALNFESRLNDYRRNLVGAVIAASLLLPIALVSAAPDTTRLWASRVLGGSNQPWPQKTYLQIAGLDQGTITVPRGEPFVLRVNARSGSVVPETVALRFREEGGDRVDANLTAFGPNDFRYDFSAINSPITVELSGGDDSFGPFVLRPADRPGVSDLKLIAQHPTEKNPTTYNFNGTDADLSFLPKTRMQLLFTANTPIVHASLKSSTTQPAATDLRQLDDRHFSVSWTQASAVQLEVNLVSRDAGLASVPTTLSIGLKTDQPPRITLGYSGVKSRVTNRAKIPLTVDARDDYGLARVVLIEETDTPNPNDPAKLFPRISEELLFGSPGPATQTQVLSKHTLELEALKLPMGSLITVNASATDDCYTGPQTTKSRPITFRVVAPEELFREILLRQQSERAKFRKQSDQARSVREQLNAGLSPESASSVASRHRAMQLEITRVNTALTQTLTEMRLNALGTDEAYDLMQKKVLSPLQQLNDELLNPQKDALDGLRPGDAAGLAAAVDREDQIIDRMSLILKQMSQWDSFVDVLNQLNEIIKLQDQAQQKTTELKKKETEGIFDK